MATLKRNEKRPVSLCPILAQDMKELGVYLQTQWPGLSFRLETPDSRIIGEGQYTLCFVDEKTMMSGFLVSFEVHMVHACCGLYEWKNFASGWIGDVAPEVEQLTAIMRFLLERIQHLVPTSWTIVQGRRDNGTWGHLRDIYAALDRLGTNMMVFRNVNYDTHLLVTQFWAHPDLPVDKLFNVSPVREFVSPQRVASRFERARWAI